MLASVIDPCGGAPPPPRRAEGSARLAVFVLFLSAAFGAATRLDDFLVLFLRQDSGEAFLPAFTRNFDFSGAILWAAGFAVLGLALASLLARLSGRAFEEGFALASRPFATLAVPCGLTALSVFSVLISPAYPYGIGLPLSLNLEGWFKPILTAGLLLAVAIEGRGIPDLPRLSRWSSPLIVAAALVLFSLATPRDFYLAGAGQGNMFKYVRMAQSLAAAGSLDIEKADAAAFSSFLSRIPRFAAVYAEESKKLALAIGSAALEGRLYTGTLTASRANRSMFRSAEGGIYYINAPGPGILLVPAVLADQALNRAFGGNRQLAVILFWQLLGALLVLEMVRAGSAVSTRAAALVTAFAIASVVPILLYSFQVYPELPAALLLLFAFRKLVLDLYPSALGALAAGAALAFLPWLHQKYSLVAFVLGLMGLSRFLHRRPGQVTFEPVKLALLVLPMVLSAYSVFLYNHALTGSLSPTATFDAVARTSFAPSGILRGFLGLLFDRENGLFVFAPLYLFALAGLSPFSREWPRFSRPLVLVVVSYLLVIASFPYWPGAVSTMGRYISSILPLLVLPMAFLVRRAFVDGAVAGAAVTLGAGSLAMSASFVQDLVPSWQPDLLWDRVLYSDPGQYLPDFVSGGIVGSGPAHGPKLLAEALAAAFVVFVLRRTTRGGFARGATAGAAAVVAVVIGVAALLERLPGNPAVEGKPRFRETRSLDSSREISVEGEHGFEGEGVWVPGGGRTRFLLLSQEAFPSLVLSLANGPEENRVVVRERGSVPFVLDLPPEGPHERTVLLRKPYRFDGPRGERFLYVFEVRSRGSFIPREAGLGDDGRRLGTYVRVR